MHVDVLSAPAKKGLYQRLEVIYHQLERHIRELNPQEVAIEDIFHSKNARGAFHLGLARGVVVAVCLAQKIKIYEYTPTQVKSVVTGYGRADKEQVKRMTELTLGTQIKLKYDATDALAVAICHASAPRTLTC